MKILYTKSEEEFISSYDYFLFIFISGFSTDHVMRVLMLGLEHPNNDVREAALSCIVDVYKIVSVAFIIYNFITFIFYVNSYSVYFFWWISIEMYLLEFHSVVSLQCFKGWIEYTDRNSFTKCTN